MKNFNRAGGELSSKQYDKKTLLVRYEDLFNPAKDEYKDRSLLALGRYLCRPLSIGIFLLFINLAIQPVYGQETDGLSEIKPLRIGDRVPEEVWNRIIPVLSPNGNRSQISLQDYSDGIIILDFWGTWCSNCISGFPKLFELQDKFAEEKILFLPVVKQKEEIITRVMETTVIKDIPNFRTANDDGYLFDLFPTQGYPYAVIIQYGKVYALTRPSHINEVILHNILAKKEVYIPTKRDSADIFEAPLLVPRFSDIRNQSPIYYSTLMGFQEGITSGNYFSSGEDKIRWIIINRPLLSLFELAWGYRDNKRVLRFKDFPNRRIVLLDKPEEMPISTSKFKHVSNQIDLSNKSKTYSYDLHMPSHLTRESVRQRLAQDLNDFFGVDAYMQPTAMSCYVLDTLDGEGIGRFAKQSGSYSTNQLAVYLNYPIFQLMPVLSNIENTSVPKIELEKRPYSLVELNLLLAPLGLVLNEEVRWIDMFIIKEKGMTENIEVDRLTLAPDGFILKQ